MKSTLFPLDTVLKCLIASVLVLIGGLIFTGPATAEGGCPDGYYPISLQGATSCAPIPYRSQGQGYQAAPLPSLPSIDRYGVLVFGEAKDGVHKGYTSAAFHERQEAIDAAMEQCQSKGSLNCRVARVMFSNCVSVAKDSGGKLYASEAMSCADDTAIDRNALAACSAQGGQACRTFAYISAWQR